jgi:4-amino-4-deoxy-L-arabinose transferase-like glycosyltransferase
VVFLWWAAIFLFFSVSASKRPSYILPVFPPAALLTGYYLDAEVLAKKAADRNAWGKWGVLLLGATFAGFIIGGLGFPVWAGWNERHLLTAALVLGLILVAAGGIALLLLIRGGTGRAVAAILVGILLAQAVAQWSLVPQIDSRRSPAEAARQVLQTANGAHVVSFRFDKASLALYGLAENGRGGRGEVYYLRHPRLLGYFLNNYQATAYVIMQTKQYRELPEELRSRTRVVLDGLRYGKYRTILLANRQE